MVYPCRIAAFLTGILAQPKANMHVVAGNVSAHKKNVPGHFSRSARIGSGTLRMPYTSAMLKKNHAFALLAAFLSCVTDAFAQTPDTGVDYRVVFQGVVDKQLREWLEKISTLKQKDKGFSLPFGLFDKRKEERLPVTARSLEKQAREDLPELLKGLHARGYYDATIRLELEEDSNPLKVAYIVAPGKRYQVASEQFTLLLPTPPDVVLPDLAEIKPSLGKAAEAGVLIDGARMVGERIAEENCLRSVEVNPALRLEPEVSAAHVYFEVMAGPKADFGILHIVGNETVRDRAIRLMVPWEEGECFHADRIAEAQAKLIKSGLFASIDITPADATNERGRVPVTVAVKERFHRTIKAGLSYMTDEGFGASVGWEHRNLFGDGEKLEALGVVSMLEYSLEGNYTEPYFLRKGQSLKLGARIAHEEPDAYSSGNVAIAALVERERNERWRVGAGLGYRLSRVQDPIDGEETYGLVSLPLYGAYDRRDDILDPEEGINARLDGAPYFDTLGSNANFFKVLATGSAYFPLPGSYEPVLAVRGTLGSISGASTRAVPADVRFYAGGGSSVRGYGYRELSPLRNGKPTGGKSLLEASVELRFRTSETWGGAVFLDGGNAFEGEYPDFKEDIRFGAGAGVRYFSDFGPLRLDVAVPLNKRDGDGMFQLYVSLGQAF